MNEHQERGERLAQRHRRPPGVSDDEVRALGKLSEALETTIRARGHLYSFHQLTGHADLMLDEAVKALRRSGAPDPRPTRPGTPAPVRGRGESGGHQGDDDGAAATGPDQSGPCAHVARVEGRPVQEGAGLGADACGRRTDWGATPRPAGKIVWATFHA